VETGNRNRKKDDSAMISKGKKKGAIRFAIQANGAKKVEVAGSFSGWKPVAMRKNAIGEFVKNEPLGPGTHEYKFLVDGQWVTDPDHGEYAMNPYGTMNSVVRLEE